MSGMSDVPNEVIVYRGLMYAMYRPRTLLPQVNLYITALGGDFWKHLNGEFAVNVTIKIHFSFIVWKITFSQEDALLQSFTKKYFIVNKRFWENSKIQDTKPPHTLVLRKRTAYLMFVLYE